MLIVFCFFCFLYYPVRIAADAFKNLYQTPKKLSSSSGRSIRYSG